MSHRISRRNFLRIGALTAAGSVLTGCHIPRRWVTLEPFVRPPEEQVSGQATWYATTCRQCPAGCGMITRVMNGRALKVEGNPEHPLNRGKLCPRGQSSLHVLYNPDRLKAPAVQTKRGSRQFQDLYWNEAVNRLAGMLSSAGSGVAVWLGSTTSGHLVDLFQKLTGALGSSAPVVFDLYTGLHGYPVVQANALALHGENDLPGYTIGSSDVVFSFGADIFGTGLSTTRYGIEYGQMRSQPLGFRGFLVQFEPRITITGAKADQWMPIRPGTEALVAQAMVRIIADQALGSPDRVAQAKALAGQVDINQAAQTADIPVNELIRLAGIFARARNPVAIPGKTLTGQPEALTALASVDMLNLIASAGVKGAGSVVSAPLPVSGMAKAKVSPFGDVTALIDRMNSGQIKLLMVYGANPVYDLPPKFGLAQALTKVPTVVSFSPAIDETAVNSDLILPDLTPLESWGYEIVSPNFGAPVIGAQQPVVKPVFDGRATADVILAAAKRVSGAAAALIWADEVAFLRETIAKLPPGAAGGSGADVLWARFLQHGGWWPVTTPAPAAATPAAPAPPPAITPQYQGAQADFPYFLDIYTHVLLSDGRGANQLWLQGVPDPVTTICWQTWVEMHPDTAAKLGMDFGDIARVTSPFGEVELPVYTHPGIRPDTVSIPTGQGHTDYGQFAQNRGANPMVLVGSQPASQGGGMMWANLRVKVEKTGKKMKLALFENKNGSYQSFIIELVPTNQ